MRLRSDPRTELTGLAEEARCPLVQTDLLQQGRCGSVWEAEFRACRGKSLHLACGQHVYLKSQVEEDGTQLENYETTL